MYQLNDCQNQHGYWDITGHISPMKLEDEDDDETRWIEELKDPDPDEKDEKAKADKKSGARDNETPSK